MMLIGILGVALVNIVSQPLAPVSDVFILAGDEFAAAVGVKEKGDQIIVARAGPVDRGPSRYRLSVDAYDTAPRAPDEVLSSFARHISSLGVGCGNIPTITSAMIVYCSNEFSLEPQLAALVRPLHVIDREDGKDQAARTLTDVLATVGSGEPGFHGREGTLRSLIAQMLVWGELVKNASESNLSDVRFMSVSLLGSRASGGSVPPGLRRLLADPSAVVRVAAAREAATLVAVEDRETIDTLLSIACNQDDAGVVGELQGILRSRNLLDCSRVTRDRIP